MGIRTPVVGVKGRHDWPDYTISACASKCLRLYLKIYWLFHLYDRCSFFLNHYFELFHALTRYGTWLSCSDRPAINPGNRCHFRSCSSYKNLICTIKIEISHVPLLQSNAQGSCNLNCNHPCDAPQVVQGWRGDNHTIFNDKDVVSRPFRNISVCIKEDSLISAFIVSFNLGKDVI